MVVQDMIFIILISVLSMILLILLVSLYFSYNVLRWPTTKGVVQCTYILEQRNKTTKIRQFLPRIRYVYRVGEDEYESKRISLFFDDLFVDKKSARNFIEDYDNTKSIVVYYHPLMRWFSVLKIDKQSKKYHIISVIIVFVLELMSIIYYYF